MIIRLHDGNYLLAGHSNSTPGGNKTAPNKGDEDYWIVKIDAYGNKLWDRSYGGYETEKLESVSELENGGLLLGGWTTTTYPDGDKTEPSMALDISQSWLLILDSVGNKLWDKTILSPTYGNHVGYAVPAGNNCYIIGTTSSSNIGGHKTQASKGESDYWVMKFCEEPVGIGEITDKVQIQVYPNPTAGDISISTQQTNLQKATFTLTNAIGQIVYQRDETNLADSYTKMLDLRNLPSGSYFVTVETNGERIIKQVVKQ